MSKKLQTKVQANTTKTFTPVLQKPRPLSDSYHHILRRRDHHEPIGREVQPGQPVHGTPAFIDPSFGHDFSRVRIFNEGAGRNLPIQAKLRINKPGDVYEQEADRVAEQVMRMEEPGVQRQVGEEEETLQSKEIPSQIPEVTPNLEARINAIRGGGQPLPESTRAFFEPRFGHDFSQVRVHMGANAAETARVLNARAFTLGQDVVFGAGQYAPEAGTGQRLIAHELAHVVQQGATSKFSGAIQRQDGKEEGKTTISGETITIPSETLNQIDEWELKAEKIIKRNITIVITSWTDFIIDSQVNLYALEPSAFSIMFDFLRDQIPFKFLANLMQEIAIRIFTHKKLKTQKITLEKGRKEVKTEIGKIVREVAREWDTLKVTRKAQELRRHSQPQIPELPAEVPNNFKQILYVGWLQSQSEIGRVPARVYKRGRWKTTMTGYGVKPAPDVPREAWMNMLTEAVNPPEGASWARERDPLLQREVIKRFIFEEGGVVLFDSEDVEKEGGSTCIRYVGGKPELFGRSGLKMPKERWGEVRDASKANQAAHGYIGELFTEENEKIFFGDRALITMDTNAMICAMPKQVTIIEREAPYTVYDSITKKPYEISERIIEKTENLESMKPSLKHYFLRATIEIPRRRITFEIKIPFVPP
ncbi:MAG: protein of unknown function (DUF4157) [Candidatus Methanocomedens sp.]|nr:MAG: protein of unknown function (DUF4157) [ANME-2 cluster archaeon]